MIEVTVTTQTNSETFKMSISEWLELRDAQFGVAPIDDKIGTLLNPFGVLI